jgi:Xaa-Pro dipeptidase
VAEGLARTLDEMARQDIDVLVLGREGNARFVSDATRLWLAGTRPFAPGCVVVRETEAVHLMSVTDFGVPTDIPPERLFPMSWNPGNIMAAVANIPGVSGARRIGVDGLTPLFEQLFAATWPNAELADGEALMREARHVKTRNEVERIGAAIEVAQEALGAAVDALRPGVRECDLKAVFAERMCELGTTTPALEPTFCVGSGRNLVSDRRIEEAELVSIRVGAVLGGYEGSLARTWPCGAPTPDHQRRYSTWSRRLSELVPRCRTGARAGDVRAIAPAVTLHGVGLGFEGLADDAVLEAGMVVQLGLEADGILAADTLLLGDDEPETLTMFPRFPSGG